MAKNVIQDMGVDYFLQNYVGMLALIEGTYYKVWGIKDPSTGLEHKTTSSWQTNQRPSLRNYYVDEENFHSEGRADTPQELLYLFRNSISASEGAPPENFRVFKNGFIIQRPSNQEKLRSLLAENEQNKFLWEDREPDKYVIGYDDDDEEYQSDEITDDWYEWKQEGEYYEEADKYFNTFMTMLQAGEVSEYSIYQPFLAAEEHQPDNSPGTNLENQGLFVMVKALTNLNVSNLTEIHEDKFKSLACFPRPTHKAVNIKDLHSLAYYNVSTRGIKVCSTMEVYPEEMLHPTYPQNFVKVFKQMQGKEKGRFHNCREVIMKDGTLVQARYYSRGTDLPDCELKLINKGRELAKISENGTIRSSTKEIIRYINEISNRLGDNL